MTWYDLKQLIEDDLLSRGLKDPSIRLRALERIEEVMNNHFPEYIVDISNFKNIEKEEFKAIIAEKKGTKLNGAENSVINDIFVQIQYGEDESNRGHNSHQKYMIISCPYCFMQFKLMEDLYDEKYLHCPECHNDFQNPRELEKTLKLEQKAEAISKLATLIPQIIFAILFLIFLLSILFGCQGSPNKYPYIVGTWADDLTPGIYYRMVETSKNTYVMNIGDMKDWRLLCPLKKSYKGGKEVYQNATYGYDEYYMIDGRDNLNVYDNYGHIATYKER